MKDVFDRTLIISPHCDDETIGCGGLLHRISQSGQEALILTIANSNSYSHNVKRFVTNEERVAELKKALNILGSGNIKHMQLTHPDYQFTDGSLDLVPKKIYVSLLDDIIEKYKPTAVLFPYQSHHQDHKLVNEVSVAALRPTIDTNFIKLKAMYEYTYYDGWNPNKLTNKLYVELSEENYKKKVEALDCFESQIRRDKRDLLDLSAIKDLARIRGREISTFYAEAFYPLAIIYPEDV